jgi:hypothetical protein
MVIIDKLPFNFVEGKGFRIFSRTVTRPKDWCLIPSAGVSK